MTTGYGKEMWCTDSLSTGRYVTGWRVVAQALYRRLTTAQGRLRGLPGLEGGGELEAAYGLDLAGFLGAVGVERAELALPGLIRGECKKDDRVDLVDVTVSRDGETLTIEISVRLYDEGDTFALTLDVTTAAVELVKAA